MEPVEEKANAKPAKRDEKAVQAAPRHSPRVLVDVFVKEVADFRDREDFETLAGLCASYDRCSIPIEELRKGSPSLGFEFSREPSYFKDFLVLPFAQLLKIENLETKQIEGAAMYLTNGSLPQDLVPYIEELKRATGRAIENCAFVQSAWITEPARQDRLYPALTGRMMREIFEDFDQDFALAYYRESPSPNTAIDAHKAMGWQILDFTTTDVFNFPINIAPPTEPESGYRKDENRFREALIDFQGGLTRRYLLYTREMWQQKRDELLNAPHTFIDEDEHFVFRH